MTKTRYGAADAVRRTDSAVEIVSAPVEAREARVAM
jgi:hypothetical protein